MLICLSRPLRIYLIGNAFELTVTQAAEALSVTPASFGQRLRRVRLKVRKFLSGNGGLIQPGDSCRRAASSLFQHWRAVELNAAPIPWESQSLPHAVRMWIVKRSHTLNPVRRLRSCSELIPHLSRIVTTVTALLDSVKLG